MSLSVSKLRQFLNSLGYNDVSYFTENDYCCFIEVASEKTSISFVVYLPSKYKLKMVSENNVYPMKLLDLDNANTDITENVYGDGVINIPPTEKDEMNEHLETLYKKDITLKNMNDSDNKELLSIHSQLNRLKLCTQRISYKISIIYKNFFSVIRRDDTVECYQIKHFPRNPMKKMYIVVDLDTLYKKPEQIDFDISTVQSEISKLLERNQQNHSTIIDSIIDNKADITAISNQMKLNRKNYENYIERLTNLIEGFNLFEIEQTTEITRLNNIITSNNDTDMMKKKFAIEQKLDRVGKIKSDVFKFLNGLKSERENVLLSIDDILFSNTVMIDGMFKNFKQLKKYMS
jgi:hypothetical protein